MRLGFISNSSSSTFIISYPKKLSEKEVCEAKLVLEDPPAETLAQATRYYDSFKEPVEELLKSLTVYRKDEKRTIYNITIPFDICTTYEQFSYEMDFYDDEHESHYSNYKSLLKTKSLGVLGVSNESGDTLYELLYFIGFSLIALHPKIEIEDSIMG